MGRHLAELSTEGESVPVPFSLDGRVLSALAKLQWSFAAKNARQALPAGYGPKGG
jgi:hypothetical protein